MTEKKIKKHLKRIWFHWYRLQAALNAAHDADVINYDGGTYNADAPCWALWECRERIEKTTKDQLADAIQCGIRGEVS